MESIECSDPEKRDDSRSASTLKIEDVVLAGHPTYEMAGLLPAGARGTEYQLSVFLVRLLELRVSDPEQDFEAVVEIEGRGNLDDVGIIIKNGDTVHSVESYQVKYYNHDIAASDFFNQDLKATSKKTKKNEKMHIGKFFEGWLSWRQAYPTLPDKRLKSILYSNASLDGRLSLCVNSGTGEFHDGFVDGTQHVLICQKRKIAKDFLTELKKPKIEPGQSQRIWEILRRKGFLDGKGRLTDKFTPNVPDFTLGLSKKDLPQGLTSELVLSRLAYDLYDVLYQQAWQYLQAKPKRRGKNAGSLALTGADKEKLFRRFLGSFEFRVKQPDLDETEDKMRGYIQRLKLPSVEFSRDVFLGLYYAVRKWFLEDYEQSSTPRFTKTVLDQFLKAYKVYHDMFVLINRSRVALEEVHYITYRYQACFVERGERVALQEALKRPGLVMVTGPQGIGKSCMVKKALESYSDDEYLFLSGIHIAGNKKLRKSLGRFLRGQINARRILILDGVEALLSIPESELVEWFRSCERSKRTVVLTSTEEALRRPVFCKMKGTQLAIQPLSWDRIVQVFFELAYSHYQNITPLVDFVRIPSHLERIMRQFEQTRVRGFGDVSIRDDEALEAKLVKLMLKGDDKKVYRCRCLAGLYLSLKINQNQADVRGKIVSPILQAGIQSLLNGKIILIKNDRYHFVDPLFFNYFLMKSWFKDWKKAISEDSSLLFWKERNAVVTSEETRDVFAKWLLHYWGQLEGDLMANIAYCCFWNPLASSSCFVTLVTRAFASNRFQILEQLLSAITPRMGRLLSTVDVEKIEDRAQRRSSSASDRDEESDSGSSRDEASEEQSWQLESDVSSDEVLRDEYQIPESSEEDEAGKRMTRFCTDPSKYWATVFDKDEEDEESGIGYVDEWHPKLSVGCGELYLHQAMFHNQSECLQVFMNYGKRRAGEVIFPINEDRETPLHIGALQHSYESMELMLTCPEALAGLDAKDQWGETALHNAVYVGNIKIAELLLRTGANPDSLSRVGLSPLHIALAHLDFRMVQLLCEYGADFSATPFGSFYSDMTIADFLEEIWNQSPRQHALQEEIEVFVLKLIVLLNYGRQDHTEQFVWATKCARKRTKENQEKQIAQVGDLMSWVADRAKLESDEMEPPRFLYIDKPSQFQYVLEWGHILEQEQEPREEGDKLLLELVAGVCHDLRGYILEDITRIHKIFELKKIVVWHREKIIKAWLGENAGLTQLQYDHLRQFAEESDDRALLALVEEYELEDEFDAEVTDEDTEDCSPEAGCSLQLAKTQHDSSPSASRFVVDPDRPATSSTHAQVTRSLGKGRDPSHNRLDEQEGAASSASAPAPCTSAPAPSTSAPSTSAPKPK